jgi:hypothetical protein
MAEYSLEIVGDRRSAVCGVKTCVFERFVHVARVSLLCIFLSLRNHTQQHYLHYLQTFWTYVDDTVDAFTIFALRDFKAGEQVGAENENV